ncbi:MAG: DNA-directed RNA polymerase subunit H [Candidatus Hodarchaeaceae archaeon]|nr:DNA-directed RNA polymerase subunit H [Candidatus Hodarchaeaceae archaeon]
MSSELEVGRHALVPKHEVLSKKEVEELLKQYKIHTHQLPLIKSSDPAAKAIGAKPGDVLKITRKSQTAGEAVFYRYVIEG